MDDNTTDPTQGVNPILAEAPRVTIAGKEYVLRRLGIPDVFTLFRLYSTVIGRGGLEVGVKLKGVQLGGLDGFEALILMGFTYAEESLFECFSSVLEVPVATLRNPKTFPMESFLVLTTAIAEHPDAVAFFDRLRSGKAILLPIGVMPEDAEPSLEPVSVG